MKSNRPKAVVFVYGGTVQEVIVNDERLEVIVVDYDERAHNDRPLKTNRNGEKCRVEVYDGEEGKKVNSELVRYWKSKGH